MPFCDFQFKYKQQKLCIQMQILYVFEPNPDPSSLLSTVAVPGYWLKTGYQGKWPTGKYILIHGWFSVLCQKGISDKTMSESVGANQL